MRRIPTEKDILQLKKELPEGSKIKLLEMGEDPNPLSPGDIGVVDFIDDYGTVWCTWESGRDLGLVWDIDKYEILEKKEDSWWW